MIARLITAVCGVLAVVALATNPVVAAMPTENSPLVIRGVSVVPMSEGTTILREQDVVVRGGKIAAIGRTGAVPIPRGAKTIDGRGQYLIPGLADMHVHLEYIEDPAVLRLFLASGVTTVRSMDGRPYILDWRNQIREGVLLGPQIVTAGPIIDGSPPARDDNLAVGDAAAARSAVSDQAALGYDFIKLYSNLTSETYAAAADEARQKGLKVAGHVPRGVSLETAVASQWSIEHLGDFAGGVAADGATVPGWARRSIAAPLDSARVADLAGQLAASRTWVVPTLIQQDRFLAPPSKVEQWLAEPAINSLPAPVLEQWKGALKRFSGRMDADDWAMLDRARQNRLAVVGALYRAGVPMVLGTDTPNPFVAMGASVHIELANLVAAGLTPHQALKAATVAPARMLGLAAEQGTVEVGKRADLLLLSGNPLDDISRSSDIAGMALGGRWFSAAELKALPQPFKLN